MVGGYDHDPRSLWDIPEAAAFVRAFAQGTGLNDAKYARRIFMSTPERREFSESCLAVLKMCQAFTKNVDNVTVKIVDDP